jgi:hypothetical protein
MFERMDYFSFIILAHAHFPYDAPRNSIDLSFARCISTGESGSAPPNRRASAIREKTTNIDFSGPVGGVHPTCGPQVIA